MEYVLLTFPRSGSHYLQQLIYQKTGLFIEKTHHIAEVKNRKIISIIRKPEDTFRSISVMDRFYSDNKDIGIGLPIDNYVLFYDYLINNSLMLIDYEDLVFKTDKLIKSISYYLGLKLNSMKYEDVLVDQPHYKHLVSSKISEEYDKVDLSKFDLSKPNIAFENALLHCIQI